MIDLAKADDLPPLTPAEMAEEAAAQARLPHFRPMLSDAAYQRQSVADTRAAARNRACVTRMNSANREYRPTALDGFFDLVARLAQQPGTAGDEARAFSTHMEIEIRSTSNSCWPV